MRQLGRGALESEIGLSTESIEEVIMGMGEHVVRFPEARQVHQ